MIHLSTAVPQSFQSQIIWFGELDFVYTLWKTTEERVAGTLSFLSIVSSDLLAAEITDSQLSTSLLAQALKNQLIPLPSGPPARARQLHTAGLHSGIGGMVSIVTSGASDACTVCQMSIQAAAKLRKTQPYLDKIA